MKKLLLGLFLLLASPLCAAKINTFELQGLTATVSSCVVGGAEVDCSVTIKWTLPDGSNEFNRVDCWQVGCGGVTGTSCVHVIGIVHPYPAHLEATLFEVLPKYECY